MYYYATFSIQLTDVSTMIFALGRCADWNGELTDIVQSSANCAVRIRPLFYCCHFENAYQDTYMSLLERSSPPGHHYRD